MSERGRERSQRAPELLAAVSDGDPAAREELLATVYDELRLLARAQLRRRSRGTLATTDVVHEAYLKLFANSRLSLRDRGHFFCLAARAMRQVLVDRYRSRHAAKRGGGAVLVTLDTAIVVAEDDGAGLLAVHQALERLEGLDRRQAQVVELKFFGGLSQREVAEALQVSTRTVSADWRHAKAWLTRELGASAG